MIIVKYILEVYKIVGIFLENVVFVKLIVLIELVIKIVESYGVIMFNVLIGFKFIVEKI